jgi:hypothetical protein
LTDSVGQLGEANKILSTAEQVANDKLRALDAKYCSLQIRNKQTEETVRRLEADNAALLKQVDECSVSFNAVRHFNDEHKAQRHLLVLSRNDLEKKHQFA